LQSKVVHQTAIDIRHFLQQRPIQDYLLISPKEITKAKQKTQKKKKNPHSNINFRLVENQVFHYGTLMKSYAFILGRKNLLSTAELQAVLKPENHIIDLGRETLIAAFKQPLTRPQESLNKLGGTTKIAEVFAEFPLSAEDFASPVSAHLIETLGDQSGKLPYGLSVYNFSQKHEVIIKKVLINVKKSLKATGIKSRFINKNFGNLKTAAIIGEKLIQKGAEILIIQGDQKIYFAQTVAIQDIDAYSHRDFSRPVRNARLGMLPPKLAQIMINLGGKTNLDNPPEKGTTLYDPFAGIGTILTEGLLMEYNVVGSDINQEVLDGSQENISWTYQQDRNIAHTSRLFLKDATTLKPNDLPEEINLVVTESYLGPPLKNVPEQGQIARNFKHIHETIIRFFREIHPILQAKTPIIISFPAYRDGKKYHTIQALSAEIEQLGYKKDPLLETHESLIYDRPDQTVCREIHRFILK